MVSAVASHQEDPSWSDGFSVQSLNVLLVSVQDLFPLTFLVASQYSKTCMFRCFETLNCP